MIEIHPLGYIKGGLCDKAHQARAQRVEGAWQLWYQLEDHKGMEYNNGWIKIIKIHHTPEKDLYKMGSNREIGYRRFRSDVVESLIEKKQSFRFKWMELWLEQICSFEFGFEMENPLSILDGTAKCGYGAPWYGHLYEKRKEQGHFPNTASKGKRPVSDLEGRNARK